MAIDAYIAFQMYGGAGNGAGPYLTAESQVDVKDNTEPLMTTPTSAFTAGTIFELEDYSFDIEQVLNIGSSSSGAGAGKVTFNPFSITRKIDKASPKFFEMACSGTAFSMVSLGIRKSVGAAGGGAGVSGMMFVRFDFKLVAVKTISWAHDDEAPKETITFEYGGLQVRYNQQDPSGAMTGGKAGIFPGGWNRVTNKQDTTSNYIT